MIFFIYNLLKLLTFILYINIFDKKLLDKRNIIYLEYLIELNGPICIKIFQWLTNNGTVSMFNGKLINIQKQINKHSINYSKKIIKEEIKDSVSITDEVLFSGSMGQIYKCTYKKTPCCLKIIHPINKNNLNRWIKIISFLSKFSINLKQEEIYNFLKKSLDLRIEGKNLDLFRENFKNTIINFPQTYCSSKNTLIMDYLDGIFIYDIESTELKMKIYKILVVALLKMLLTNHVHSDLHSSNWNVMIKESKIVSINIFDCGIVSSYKLDENINRLIYYLLTNNKYKILKYFYIFLDDKNIYYTEKFKEYMYNDWDKNYLGQKSIKKLCIYDCAKFNVKVPVNVIETILSFLLLGTNIKKSLNIKPTGSNRSTINGLLKVAKEYNFNDVYDFLYKCNISDISESLFLTIDSEEDTDIDSDE